MADYPAMPLWTDAYLSDTIHFSTIEHGAYLLLLMCMWRSGGSLPNDDAKLAKYARLTSTQWKRIKPTVIECFQIDSGRLVQRRLTKELAFVRRQSQLQSDRARAKSLKDNNLDEAPAQPELPSGSAPTPTPIEEKDVSNDTSKKTPRSILETVLSVEAANDLLDHRQRLRCPLTPRAAQLLVNQFQKVEDPRDAVDMMIERGWRGFSSEWYENSKGVKNAKGSKCSNADRRADEIRKFRQETARTHGEWFGTDLSDPVDSG